MNDELAERCREIGQHIADHKCTIRQAAKVCGVSKSTVFDDVTKRLPKQDKALYRRVRRVLNKNKATRHIRGGEATRRKFKK